MKRERFSSRLGFILISAGCAIGLGNVWRFPYIVGKYGGAAFVLVYLFFLISLGLPIMVMEYAVGRASQRSAATSFDVLEPKGSKWHIAKAISILGNYLLMMFYTTVAGWMLIYFVKMLTGAFNGLSTSEINAVFPDMLASPMIMFLFMAIVVGMGIVVCSKGLQNGLEIISKFMMIALLALMGVLAIRSVTLPGALEGVKYYLIPDFSKMMEAGFGEVVSAAMAQAFFTLSLGIGSIQIFGSYLDKDRSLLGESINVVTLDTLVALTAGLIVIPACFAYGVNPGEGPGLVFITLPNIFASMPLGSVWGSLFFLFMSFAALTTVFAVFENIFVYTMDLFGWDRKKAITINGILLFTLSIPCILGYNVWSNITFFGMDIQTFEDFIVSSNLLPLGSLVYLLFCTSKYGWGWDNFIKEANAGSGIKFPTWIRPYVTYVLPLVILYLFIQGYIG